MDIVLYVLFDVVITGFALFLACKITGVLIEPFWLFVAVVGAAMLTFTPVAGWVLSLIFLFYILNTYSNAKIWPDLVLMVIISRLISLLLFMPIIMNNAGA